MSTKNFSLASTLRCVPDVSCPRQGLQVVALCHDDFVASMFKDGLQSLDHEVVHLRCWYYVS
jgi:hypothetical protein